MKVGIDLDEIVVEFVKGYLGIFKKKYWREILLDNIFSYNLY